MKPDRTSTNDPYSLTYWHAIETFGDVAVEAVINQASWSKEHPEVIKRANSREVITRNQTALPGAMIQEIAGRSECKYDFYEDEEQQVIYASFNDQELVRPFDVSKAKLIDRQDALLEYGAYSLFKAVDTGVGRRGE
jgi:hypothetical protein